MSTIPQASEACAPTSPQLTRSRLIAKRTEQAIASSGLNVLKFASRVAERFLASVPQFQRCVQFYDSGSTLESALDAERANGKLVDRFLKGAVKFPADLEECWVDSLPEPYRSDLVRELAWRYGLLGARLPAVAHHEHVARLADVLADAGRTAVALAPLFDKGKLNVEGEGGARIAQSMLTIRKAIADLVSLEEQIKAQLPSAKASAPAKRRG
jgi:hypothetical protein